MDTTVGIEAVAVHIPRYYLDLRSLAKANAVDPAKYLQGLGGRRFAVAAPSEDPVTLGFDAAQSLMEKYSVDPSTIGLLVVGTESGVDGAKPIASYLHGLLGLPPDCRTFDTKHACYSGTAAMRMASDWCVARSGGKKTKALVVATDIARYSVGAAGEPTQGASAVAMLISDEPKCFIFEPFQDAVFSEEVMDFWRPHYRSTAMVDGKTSIHAYLKGLRHTWDDYTAGSNLSWDDFEYMLFHVPFPKMAYKGFKALYEMSGLKEDELDDCFEARTGCALWANRELGNCYSASLYLSLAALLERGDQRVAGARVGMYSYGSGCCAEYFSGRIGHDASAWRERIGIAPGLMRRQELSYERYLSMRAACEDLSHEGSCVEHDDIPPVPGQRIAFKGIRDHQRVYLRQASLRSVVSRSHSARAHMGK